MEGSWSFKEGLLKDEERVLSLPERPKAMRNQGWTTIHQSLAAA